MTTRATRFPLLAAAVFHAVIPVVSAVEPLTVVLVWLPAVISRLAA